MIGAFIPVFQEEERQQGRADAEAGLDPAPPIFGWGGYQRGYDEAGDDPLPPLDLDPFSLVVTILVVLAILAIPVVAVLT